MPFFLRDDVHVEQSYIESAMMLSTRFLERAA